MDKKRGETRNGKQEKDEEEIKGRRRITEKRERKNKEMRIKSRVKKIIAHAKCPYEMLSIT